jgi:hypothetical protein
MHLLGLELDLDLSLHVEGKFVFSGMSTSRCLQDEYRSGGMPSLLPSVFTDHCRRALFVCRLFSTYMGLWLSVQVCWFWLHCRLAQANL